MSKHKIMKQITVQDWGDVRRAAEKQHEDPAVFVGKETFQGLKQGKVQKKKKTQNTWSDVSLGAK